MAPRCPALVLFPHPTVGEAVTPLTSTSPPQDCPLPDKTNPQAQSRSPPGREHMVGSGVPGLPGLRRVASALRWMKG